MWREHQGLGVKMDLFINDDAYYCIVFLLFSVGVAKSVVIFSWHIGKVGLMMHGQRGESTRRNRTGGNGWDKRGWMIMRAFHDCLLGDMFELGCLFWDGAAARALLLQLHETADQGAFER